MRIISIILKESLMKCYSLSFFNSLLLGDNNCFEFWKHKLLIILRKDFLNELFGDS